MFKTSWSSQEPYCSFCEKTSQASKGGLDPWKQLLVSKEELQEGLTLEKLSVELYFSLLLLKGVAFSLPEFVKDGESKEFFTSNLKASHNLVGRFAPEIRHPYKG